MRPHSLFSFSKIAGFFVCWLLVGCAGSSPSPAAPASAHFASSGAVYQDGIASYYHSKYAGRKTASGVRYDPKRLTAAHRSLPFGTVVEVRAKKSGRRVIVEINDRGPFSKNKKRVIDLSRRAAEELNMIRAGIIDVELRILSSPSRG